LRPGLILNVTSDAWFGGTPGPYQHFAQARLRAVEEGLPLVRAANTGISAVIDPYGRITRALPLDAEGVIDASLPRACAHNLLVLGRYDFRRFARMLRSNCSDRTPLTAASSRTPRGRQPLRAIEPCQKVAS
jgi:hypothetical protein